MEDFSEEDLSALRFIRRSFMAGACEGFLLGGLVGALGYRGLRYLSYSSNPRLTRFISPSLRSQLRKNKLTNPNYGTAMILSMATLISLGQASVRGGFAYRMYMPTIVERNTEVKITPYQHILHREGRGKKIGLNKGVRVSNQTAAYVAFEERRREQHDDEDWEPFRQEEENDEYLYPGERREESNQNRHNHHRRR